MRRKRFRGNVLYIRGKVEWTRYTRRGCVYAGSINFEMVIRRNRRVYTREMLESYRCGVGGCLFSRRRYLKIDVSREVVYRSILMVGLFGINLS